jgi:excisionase family DNA binding protein
MKPQANRQYLTASEVAAQLRVRPRTVLRLIHMKELTALHIGEEFLIEKSDLAAFIGAHTIPAQPGYQGYKIE